MLISIYCISGVNSLTITSEILALGKQKLHYSMSFYLTLKESLEWWSPSQINLFKGSIAKTIFRAFQINSNVKTIHFQIIILQKPSRKKPTTPEHGKRNKQAPRQRFWHIAKTRTVLIQSRGREMRELPPASTILSRIIAGAERQPALHRAPSFKSPRSCLGGKQLNY